jgi:hypothetical protein
MQMRKVTTNAPDLFLLVTEDAIERKVNRLSASGQERLRQAALANRPWEHTTGPKTAAGILRSAENGKLRQKGPLSVRGIRSELAEAAALVKSMAALRAGILRR